MVLRARVTAGLLAGRRSSIRSMPTISSRSCVEPDSSRTLNLRSPSASAMALAEANFLKLRRVVSSIVGYRSARSGCGQRNVTAADQLGFHPKCTRAQARGDPEVRGVAKRKNTQCRLNLKGRLANRIAFEYKKILYGSLRDRMAKRNSSSISSDRLLQSSVAKALDQNYETLYRYLS
jgi:hypothetical protein